MPASHWSLVSQYSPLIGHLSLNARFSLVRDCKPEMQMMYAGSKLELVNKVNLQHVFEVRELEEITEEWLHTKLGKK